MFDDGDVILVFVTSVAGSVGTLVCVSVSVAVVDSDDSAVDDSGEIDGVWEVAVVDSDEGEEANVVVRFVSSGLGGVWVDVELGVVSSVVVGGEVAGDSVGFGLTVG